MARIDLIRRSDALDALQIVAAWSTKEQRRALSQAYDKLHRVCAVDAVPVVRCRECKHRGNERECPMCEMVSTWDEDDGSEYYLADRTEDSGFCHNGAKMDSN